MKTRMIVLISFLALATFLVIPAESSSNECGDYENSIRWISNTYLPGDFIRAISVDWPLILTCETLAGISLTDASDIEHPVTTRVLEIESHYFWKKDNLVLVKSREDQLISIDFTNPFQPVILDTLVLSGLDFNFAENVGFSEIRAYISVPGDGLLIIDIEDPTNLSLSGIWHHDEGGTSIVVHDNVAFAGFLNGVKILSLKNPDHPHEIQSLSTPGWWLKKHGNLLAVSHPSSTTIFNIENPQYPVQIFHADQPTDQNLALGDGILALGTDYYPTKLINLNQFNSFLDFTEVKNTWLDNGFLSIQEDILLKVSLNVFEYYELNQGRNVAGTQKISGLPSINDLEYQNGFAFVADTISGFSVYQVPLGDEIELVTESYALGSLDYVQIFDNVAYVAGNLFWAMMDISNPENPIPMGQQWALSGIISQFMIQDSYLYITEHHQLQIFDIANPLDIQLVDSISLDSAQCLDVDGGFIYVGCGQHHEEKLVVYSLENNHLEQVGSLNVANTIEDIEVKNGVLLANIKNLTHLKIDTSDPTDPVLLDEFYTWSAGQASFEEMGLLVSDYYSLRFYNFDQPMEPENLGSFWFSELEGYQVIPDHRILLWGRHQMEIAPMPCSWIDTNPSLTGLPTNFITASPNPFNPSTVLEFNLPQPGFCSLEIFDLRGQKIQTICAEHRSAGTHQFTWQGLDDSGRLVSSGIYFAQLVHVGGMESSKLILLK